MKKVMKNGWNRVCAVILAAAMTLTMVPANVQAEGEAREFYRNGFEDGVFMGIQDRGANMEISTSVHHDVGNNSLVVKKRTATWHGVLLPLVKYLVSGNTYDFKAYVRQDSGSVQTIDMGMQYKDAGNATQYPTVAKSENCVSGEWVELKGSFTVPETANEISLFFQCSTSGTAEFYVDDLSISGIPKEIKEFKPNEETYDRMVKSGVYSTGNNARIKAVLQRARMGKDVSLAYIGGSITEGGGYKPNSACYAEVSAKAFAEKYGKDGGANVHFINAGMSGTPSDVGIIRYERDVLGRLPQGSSQPDILFIEFAVNDAGCETNGGAYEGLIRQALRSGSAVVLVFSVFSVLNGDGELTGINSVKESDYHKYGEKYDLPMVSTADAIRNDWQGAGFYDWFYNDSLHPNANGYKLMADCILELVDRIDKEPAEADNALDVDSIQAVTSSSFEGIKMIDAATTVGSAPAIKSIQVGGFTGKDETVPKFQYLYNGKEDYPWFADNWMHEENGAGDPLRIEVNCQTLMLLYKETSESIYGSADLYVDGVKKSTLSCFNNSGWNNGKVCIAIKEETSADHTIELKMKAGDEGKKFTLYAIGYQTDEAANEAADQAVEHVRALIDAIGEVSYEETSRKKIGDAREAYDKLTDAQKALVDNYQKLTDAETRYESLTPPAKVSITKAAVKEIEAQYYTGKAIEPPVTVTYNGSSLKAGEDYEASYKDNTNIGTATVTIKGKGNYTEEISRTFEITVKKNAAYTAGGYKYKITNARTDGKGTVSLNGVINKKGKSIKVTDTVTIGGRKFLITAIGKNAFSGCSKATSATIGKNVTTIGSRAFYNCRKLKKITVKATKLKTVGAKAFRGIHKKATIKVPKGKLKTYQNALKKKGQASSVKIKK